ncbi:MAG: hypothetical protein H7831_11680 [Magnetococcus sp. WYHC-3]
MDFKQYEPQDKYPRKEDFQRFFIYREGKVLYGNDELQRMVQLLDITDKLAGYKQGRSFNDCKANLAALGYILEILTDHDAYQKAIREYNQKEAELIIQFRMDLAQKHNVTGNAKELLLWEKAWEQGHSNGLSEVALCYDDLVVLIQ